MTDEAIRAIQLAQDRLAVYAASYEAFVRGAAVSWLDPQFR